MPNHTPAPWNIADGNIWAEASDGSYVKIATVHAVLNHISFAERNANFHLIAAAPELLNALKWSVNHSGECLGDYPKLLERANALIAKAEGEPHA